MKKLIFVLTILTLAAMWLPRSTQAQGAPPCDVEYTVQAGDWLSKISEKYFGDVLAYPVIVEATNVQTDERFAEIANADLIESGWLLCIHGTSAETAPGGEASTVDEQLVGPVWEWQKTSMNDDTTFTPDNPANYTAQFMADGQVAIKADCNQVGGTYTADGSSISIELGPSTMAMCPPDSLSDQFLAGLSGAAIYFFQDGNLFMDIKFDSGTMQFALASEANAGGGQLVGLVWEWQKTLMNDDTTFTPDNPANYTAQFMADGQVAIKADCNQVGGTYTADGSSISIELGPSTMAMCPPDSLSDQFLAGLSGVAIYFFQDDNLFMDIKFDSGTMQFALTGTAEAAPVETPDAATEIVVFDPASIETDANRAPVQGVCQPSTYVPGAYQCATETGASLDPCFVRTDGSLVCNPNPVFGSFTQLVTPSEPLPESSKTGNPVAFTLELAGNNPPCHIRTMGDGFEVAGKPVTYGCDAPAAWIIGPLDTSQPAWVGVYVITAPSSGEVTWGPTPMAVARAWVY